MSPTNQQAIVDELLQGMRDRIARAIADQTIPEDFDGPELREIIVELALENRVFGKSGGRHIARANEYRNWAICNPL